MNYILLFSLCNSAFTNLLGLEIQMWSEVRIYLGAVGRPFHKLKVILLYPCVFRIIALLEQPNCVTILTCANVHFSLELH